MDSNSSGSEFREQPDQRVVRRLELLRGTGVQIGDRLDLGEPDLGKRHHPLPWAVGIHWLRALVAHWCCGQSTGR